MVLEKRPAVPIEQSVNDEAITCLDCGQPMQEDLRKAGRHVGAHAHKSKRPPQS